MKKISLLLAVCLLLSLFSGCAGQKSGDTEETYTLIEVTPLEGEPLPVDTRGMKEYTMKCGLTFFGPSGLEEEETEAMAGYMTSSFHLVMVIREDKVGTVLENATAEEYAAMLCDSNGLTPFITDQYGNLATTYSAESYQDSEDFFYYVTVKEGTDCIWLIQIVCPVSISDESVEDMARWSATFRETE